MTSEKNLIEAELTPAPSSGSGELPKSTFKHSTSPAGAPLSQISPSIFPLTLVESFKHYWYNTVDEAQEDLLSTLPFYPTPNSTHSSEILKFKSPNSLIFPDINEFHVKPKISELATNDEIDKSKNDKHLVIMHGYGAGLGFFIKNIEDLADKHPDWHIHAIDLPGYGSSTRVTFPHSIPYDKYETVEKLFTVPLRDWYISRGLDDSNSITVAHSMGGYLSLLLQMKEVNGNGYITEAEFDYLKNKFFDNSKKEEIFQRQLKELSNTAQNPRRFWDTLILVSPAGIFNNPPEEGVKSKIPTWFTMLWNQNVSPFVLVRNTGPLGSFFVSGWTSRRFAPSALIDNNLYEKLHQYAYGIFNAKGSGEYMLNYMLAPGGVPRNPLVDRITQIGKFAGRTRWIYGGNDWIDYRGGEIACNKLKECGSPDAKWEILPNAGHHVYLDAFKAFDSLVGNEMKRMDEKKRNI